MPSLQDIENADGYDEFVITTRALGGQANASTDPSSLAFGPELTPTGLATRWAKAVAATPPGGVQVRMRPSPRHATPTVSSRDSVSTSLGWVLNSGLAELDWTVVEYHTAESPYVRFGSDQPLAAPIVGQWKAIEATLATDERATSMRSAGHRLDLKLNRKEKAAQGGAGDGDVVDDGRGSADWEAAYRQRFPDAVPVSATPK